MEADKLLWVVGVFKLPWAHVDSRVVVTMSMVVEPGKVDVMMAPPENMMGNDELSHSRLQTPQTLLILSKFRFLDGYIKSDCIIPAGVIARSICTSIYFSIQQSFG